jgi:hypothetical protein
MNRLTNSDFHYQVFQTLKDEYGFNYLDYYFSKALAKNEPEEKFGAFFFFMYLSMKTRHGSVCVDFDADKIISEFIKTQDICVKSFEKEIKACEAVGSAFFNYFKLYSQIYYFSGF